ncbi:MAG TPA: methyltransferase domain-containing protein [Polyangiaceae bacterium]|jgi:2-polyprenyl-3-methyl-5-hydroxy-6-metoxy-1,4-benzoquinol methylase|nr:methyltransferase domain-containing protein [Polyangiaceae bacterium]
MARKLRKNYIEHAGERYHERAAPEAYELALEFMSRVARGRAIDLAAGSGYTSRRLEELGFDVTAYDIFTEQFVPRDIIIRKADLNQPLPEEDGALDAVLALEVIEHLENPRAFLREIARVLKPGGSLVLSTPNIVTFGSKLRFAFLEELELFFNDVTRTRDPFCDEASGHISPLLPWLLRMFVHDAGMTVLETGYTRRWGLRTKHLGRSAILWIEKPAEPRVVAS